MNLWKVKIRYFYVNITYVFHCFSCRPAVFTKTQTFDCWSITVQTVSGVSFHKSDDTESQAVMTDASLHSLISRLSSEAASSYFFLSVCWSVWVLGDQHEAELLSFLHALDFGVFWRIKYFGDDSVRLRCFLFKGSSVQVEHIAVKLNYPF